MMLEMSSTDPPPEKMAKTSPFMRIFVRREKSSKIHPSWGGFRGRDINSTNFILQNQANAPYNTTNANNVNMK